MRPGDGRHVGWGPGRLPLIEYVVSEPGQTITFTLLSAIRNMAQPHTVIGHFDNAAEAQQAVQCLLENAFLANQIVFSTHSPLSAGSQGGHHTTGEQNTGRFFSSLFSSRDDADAESVLKGDTLITVQAQSSPEVDQAVRLLKDCRALHITVKEE